MELKCPKCGCSDDLMGDGDRIECPDCGYESREENFCIEDDGTNGQDRESYTDDQDRESYTV